MKKLILILFFPILLSGQVTTDCIGWGCDWVFQNYTVRIVTNLNDSGTGSIRAAATPNNSLVVFNVSGNINLQSILALGTNVYIATQTAFRNNGKGITIGKATNFAGPLVSANNDNVIIRYTRFSAWPSQSDCCSDNFSSTGADNIWLDHNEFRYGTDEAVSFRNSTGVFLSYNIAGYAIEKNQTPVSIGRNVVFFDGNELSFLGNVFAESGQRNPLIKGETGTAQKLEFVNNALFNTSNLGFYYEDANEGNINVYGNYVRNGNIRSDSRYMFNYINNASSGRIYSNDNLDETFRTNSSTPESAIWSDSPNSNAALDGNPFTSTPFNYPLQNSYTAIAANDFATEILPVVGANLYRDAISADLLVQWANNDGVATNPAATNALSYYTPHTPLVSAMTTPIADSDNDGIPNSQEATWGNDTFGYVNSLVSNSTPTPTCSDGIQNGTETGVDCGGSCAPCDAPTTTNNRKKVKNYIAW